jgi:spore maturation protein CgeB
MGSAYRLGKVGLNIMRWQDDAGLNLKPFEITGAGVACLCQRRVGMDECFSLGNEIEAFDSPSHAAALLSDLLANPARRKQLAAAGHAKTTSSHTWTHRAHAMTHLLRPATRAPLSAAA